MRISWGGVDLTLSALVGQYIKLYTYITHYNTARNLRVLLTIAEPDFGTERTYTRAMIMTRVSTLLYGEFVS
jgi:hypothetical protein